MTSQLRAPRIPDLNEKEQQLSGVANLSHELFAAILGFDAALALISDDNIITLIPSVKEGQLVPSKTLTHLNSDSGHNYDFTYYLNLLRNEPSRTLTQRVWASSALIRLGDELARFSYFDRHPCLELVRHLRNAVAHGEKFLIRDKEKLRKFPAALTAGRCHWEITPALNETPLYNFLSVGDIASIINSAGMYLRNRALERHVT